MLYNKIKAYIELMEVDVEFYPLRLVPVTKSIIWGGRYLEEKFGFERSGDNIAEAWILSCREDGVNMIANGSFAGKTLKDYIEAVGADNVYGSFSDFPLLVKLIDARDRLSVQVHPDDEYAYSHGLDSGKTEMWYIVDCEEDSRLVLGLSREYGIDEGKIREAILNGTLSDMLSYVSVHKGESFFIPAGLVHAIGAGIVILEIQQNSNSTFRLYDYDRVGADGKRRELHVKEAAEVIKPRLLAVQAVKSECENEGEKIEILSSCSYFEVVKHSLESGCSHSFCGGRMISLVCLSGCGEISTGGDVYEIKPGESYLIPRACGEFAVSAGDSKLVFVSSLAFDK